MEIYSNIYIWTTLESPNFPCNSLSVWIIFYIYRRKSSDRYYCNPRDLCCNIICIREPVFHIIMRFFRKIFWLSWIKKTLKIPLETLNYHNLYKEKKSWSKHTFAINKLTKRSRQSNRLTSKMKISKKWFIIIILSFLWFSEQ